MCMQCNHNTKEEQEPIKRIAFSSALNNQGSYGETIFQVRRHYKIDPGEDALGVRDHSYLYHLASESQPLASPYQLP